MIVIVIVQFLAAAAACAALYYLAATTAKKYGVAGAIVAAGAAVRAAAASLLFWISYANAPFARSLQLGDGLWFFAIDSRKYMELARAAALDPLANIPIVNPGIPSPAYVQVLAFAVILFGSSAAIGALINVFAYLFLGMYLARAASDAGRTGVVIAAVYAFAPGPILWSLQPLKDVPFVAVELLLPLAFLRWQRSVGGEVVRWREAAIAAGVMFGALYFMAGVREYYAIMVLGASAVTFVVVAATARRKRVAAAATAGALLLCVVAIFLSAPGSERLHRKSQVTAAGLSARPQSAVSELVQTPADLARDLESTRAGFVQTPAATAIATGPATDDLPVVRPLQVLLSNCAAIFLPRTIGVPLGLFVVGGGRGLWMFADLDTFIFDLAVIVALAACWRWFRRRDLKDGVLWLFGFMLLLTLPIIYVVNNFGTLFRFRMMLLLPILFLPLVVSGRSRAIEREADAHDGPGRQPASEELEQQS